MRGILVWMALLAALAASAPEPAAGQTCADTLKPPVCPGDILVTDIALNEVYRLRCPFTPCARTTLSSGQNLDSPRAVVAGPTGLIFVTESGNADAVIRIDPTQLATANQLRISSGGAFSSPRGIVIDATGDFLVAEPNDDTIYRVHPASGSQSIFSSEAGGPETFHFPSDIAREADGGLLVTDAPADPPSPAPATGKRLLRVEPSGGFPSVPSKNGLFVFPRGVAIEPNGNAVIADSGATTPTVISPSLIRIDRASAPPQTQSSVTVIGGLQGPRGIAVDASGNLIVADFTAKAVYRVHPTSGVRTTLTSGTTLGPWGVAVVGAVAAIPQSALLVADSGGSTQTIFRVTPTSATTSTTLPVAPLDSLLAPVAVTRTRSGAPWDGKILVADAGAVRAIDAAQNVTTVSEGGLLSNVTGLVVDAGGDVLVTDSVANAVIRVTPAGVQSIVGSAGGNLASPVGLVIDRDGLLVVAVQFNDTLTGARGRILRMNPVTGAYRTLTEDLTLHAIRSLALDASGDVLLTDDVPYVLSTPTILDSVRRLDARYETLSVVVNSTTGDQGSFRGVVVDADGSLIYSNDPTVDTTPKPQELRRFDPLTPTTQTLFTTGADFEQIRGIALDAAPPAFTLADPDGDLIGSSVDNCPDVSNLDQADNEFDNRGDACDDDDDNDGVLNEDDNCPVNFNDTQVDEDLDGLGDSCDNCPEDLNPQQQDFESDGVGDACDPDDDNDGTCDQVGEGTPPCLVADNCRFVPNVGQENSDSDSEGDACDTDDDGDLDLDTADNCVLVANPGQEDGDGDGVGNLCDNCATIANPLQENTDANAPNRSDLLGDVCDDDDDGDQRCDVAGVTGQGPSCNGGPDNCPLASNSNQLDTDTVAGFPGGPSGPDGLGNVCDNCATVNNPSQENLDGDAQGDVCDSDTDNDLREDVADNCTRVANYTQIDTNKDGYGNICDADFDDNGAVGLTDRGFLVSSFGIPTTSNPDLDLDPEDPPSEPPHEIYIRDLDCDSSGAIGFGDYGVFLSSFGAAPGPSGYTCAGTPPCPLPPPPAP